MSKTVKVYQTNAINLLTQFDTKHDTPCADTYELQYHTADMFNNLVENTISYKTGFDKLDKLLGGGLEPGTLTVIGGVTGMGKTTLALQMAYNLSVMHSKNVLYLALEMTEFQMQVKLLSMITAQIAYQGNRKVQPLTIEQIRSFDKWGDLSKDAADLYISAVKELQNNHHLFIHTPTQKATPQYIKDCVAKHIAATEETPVVFVDYLQYIKTDRQTVTDKQKIDDALGVLKDISIQYNTPVVTLCSLGRTGYQTPDISAAKGSGEIEYTASTLLMLAPPPDTKQAQPENIDNQRASMPGRYIPSTKRLQLTAVKNRSAAKNRFVLLDYSDQYNFFTEANSLKKHSI